MADNVETPRVLDELTRANGAPVERGRAPSRLARLLRALVVLLLTVALLALLAGLAYSQWTLQQRYNLLATDNVLLQDNLAQSSARLAALEAELRSTARDAAADEALLQSLQDQLDSRLQGVNDLLLELQNQLPRTLDQQNGRWRLAEAHHLLRLASRHLRDSADVPTTVSLLETADRLLVESGDSRARAARDALARELTTLRAMADFDPLQVSERIGRLRIELESGASAPTLQQVYLERLAADSSAGNGGDNASVVSSLLSRAQDSLRNVFIWRQWPSESDRLQSPQALYSARTELSLLLQQAQLALVTGNRAQYQGSLQRARELAGRYQPMLGEAAGQVLAELDSLAAESVFPELPELSGLTGQVGQLLTGADPAAGQ